MNVPPFSLRSLSFADGTDKAAGTPVSSRWPLVTLEHDSEKIKYRDGSTSFKLNSKLARLVEVRLAAARTPTTIEHLLALEAHSLVAPDAAMAHVGNRQTLSPPSSLASSLSESSEGTMPESPHKVIRVAEINKFCSALANPKTRFVEFVRADTREIIVTWIGKVILAMQWPLGAFFTAVHAFDFSLTDQTAVETTAEDGLTNGGLATCHPVQSQNTGSEGCIPLLSTACVLVGVSSECDHKQLAKARCFVGHVPAVSSVRDLICKQLSIVAYLTRGTLVNKTPLDFTILFLASMKVHAPTVFETLMSQGVRPSAAESEDVVSLLKYVCQLGVGDTPEENEKEDGVWSLGCLLVELCLGISVVSAVTQAYCGYPMSRIIAAIMVDVIGRIRPDLRHPSSLQWFCTSVFRLDYAWEISPVLKRLPGIYRICRSFAATENSHDQKDGPTLMCWPTKANILLSLLISKID